MDTATGALVGLIAANLLTLLTLIVKDWFAGRREERHRKWEVEDRASLASTVVDTASTLASKVERTSDTLASKVQDTSSVLAAKVEATSSVLAAKVEQQAVVSSASSEKIIDLLRQNQSALDANTEISAHALQATAAGNKRSPHTRERAGDAAAAADVEARLAALEARGPS